MLRKQESVGRKQLYISLAQIPFCKGMTNNRTLISTPNKYNLNTVKRKSPKAIDMLLGFTMYIR